MTDKVIEEVDQKLEGDLGSKKKTQQINSIFSQLSSTKRQVNKFLSLMKHGSNSLQQSKQKIVTNAKPLLSKPQTNQIGKYNYYGKKYRFQQREQLLNIEPPKVQRDCMSEINNKKVKNSNSPRTQINLADSRNATIDQSVFFDDGQIKLPSNKYYIYFEKPQNSKHINKKTKKRQQQILDNTSLPQKFKPAWFMQKKINNLQKQVKNMKERERKKFQQSSQMMRSMRSTYDGPIRLRSNIEKMVQSLWN